jgi:hypothetical protein
VGQALPDNVQKMWRFADRYELTSAVVDEQAHVPNVLASH